MFITESSTAQFDDFQQYVFELKTIATQNLAPKRIEEYLKIIFQEGGGPPMCQSVMDYIVIVLGKYLQMMSSYYIFKEDSERVTAQFEQFNNHFQKYSEIFEKITGRKYRPGEDISYKKPTAKVSPLKTKRPEEDSSNQLNTNLITFLRRYNLMALKEVFQRQSIDLEDVLGMQKDEMEEIGITTFKLRKKLWAAIQDFKGTGRYCNMKKC